MSAEKITYRRRIAALMVCMVLMVSLAVPAMAAEETYVFSYSEDAGFYYCESVLPEGKYRILFESSDFPYVLVYDELEIVDIKYTEAEGDGFTYNVCSFDYLFPFTIFEIESVVYLPFTVHLVVFDDDNCTVGAFVYSDSELDNPNYTFIFERVDETVVDATVIVIDLVGFFTDFGQANLLKYVAAGVGISGGLVLTWFGGKWVARKVIRALAARRL